MANSVICTRLPQINGCQTPMTLTDILTRTLLLACRLAPFLMLTALTGCMVLIPFHEAERNELQAAQRAQIRPGESTSADVRERLGAPWLQNRYWGVDVYTADDRIWGLAMGLPYTGPGTLEITGYLMIAYDDEGRVLKLVRSENNMNLWNFRDFPMMLQVRDLYLGIEAAYHRGVQLMADATRVPGYLAQQLNSPMCTLVLACDKSTYQKFPYEECPDRVVIDDGEPLDPKPVGFNRAAVALPRRFLTAVSYLCH
jgi:hypothetical protein